MTLRVPFESFAATVARVLGVNVVFVATTGNGTLVTAADPARSATVASVTSQPADAARASLEGQGLEVLTGQWSMVDPGDLSCDAPENFIVAIAYRSAEAKPGLWIDAYPQLPTAVQALKTMYDEFRSTGEVDEVSFEEFVRFANPNVVIVSPSDLRSFVDQKSG